MIFAYESLTFSSFDLKCTWLLCNDSWWMFTLNQTKNTKNSVPVYLTTIELLTRRQFYNLKTKRLKICHFLIHFIFILTLLSWSNPSCNREKILFLDSRGQSMSRTLINCSLIFLLILSSQLWTYLYVCKP